MPKMLGEKKGNGQFAMLQEKMIEKREEYLNLNRMVCWEWALEDQSGAKRKKSRILVGWLLGVSQTSVICRVG